MLKLILFGVASLLAVNFADALQSSQSVNINSADLQQLMSLKGIGEKRGRHILEYRKSHGPFSGLSDMSRVPGISPFLLKRIQQANTGRFRLQ